MSAYLHSFRCIFSYYFLKNMSYRNRTVYIGQIPTRTTGRDVEHFFSGFGRILDVVLRKGFGFVEFEDPRDAYNAVHALNRRELLGQRVFVELSRGGGVHSGGGDGGFGGSRGGGGERTVRSQQSNQKLPGGSQQDQPPSSRPFFISDREVLLNVLSNDKSEVKIEKISVVVRDKTHHGLQLNEREELHGKIMKIIPEKLRSEVGLTGVPGSMDRTVTQIALSGVESRPNLTHNVGDTPQSLLTLAERLLNRQSGGAASEIMWLCGSIALKNFACANRFDMKSHKAKSHTTDFLRTAFNEFDSDILSSWSVLTRCHQNGYENRESHFFLRSALTSTVKFNNVLYEIHQRRLLDLNAFKDWLPEEMKDQFRFYA